MTSRDSRAGSGHPRRLRRGETAPINGDGKYIRDYVDVTDVAAAHLCALTQPSLEPFRPFNVGTGAPINTNQLGEAIHREWGRRPEVDFVTGLRQTVEWFHADATGNG